MIFVTQWRLLLLFPVVWPIDRQTCNMVQIPGLNFWNIARYNIELVGNKACVQFHLLVHYDIDFDILALTQWRLLLLFPVKRPIDRQTCENKSDPLLLDKLFFKIHLHWVHRTMCICHKQKKFHKCSRLDSNPLWYQQPAYYVQRLWPLRHSDFNVQYT